MIEVIFWLCGDQTPGLVNKKLRKINFWPLPLLIDRYLCYNLVVCPSQTDPCWLSSSSLIFYQHQKLENKIKYQMIVGVTCWTDHYFHHVNTKPFYTNQFRKLLCWWRKKLSTMKMIIINGNQGDWGWNDHEEDDDHDDVGYSWHQFMDTMPK